MPRFYVPPEWRHVITDGAGVSLTFLDRLSTGGQFRFDLNTPAELSGRVPADSPEINILNVAPDNDPFLSEGTRRCFSFRGDFSGPGGAQFGVRHAGIVFGLDDTGDENAPYSTFTVADPWAYLYSRRCVDVNGNPPGRRGLRFTSIPVATIALQLLENTIAEHGPTGIDAGVANGGTTFHDGFLSTETDPITYVVQRGKTVGEAWEDLCATGLMDIELTPIYDMNNRPNYLCDLNIYAAEPTVTQPRGEEHPEAIFAWDRPPRTLSGIRRNMDGRARANKIQFYTKRGVQADVLTDQDSVDKYGEYWYEQQFPDQLVKERVGEWAASQLELRSRGMRTITPTPGAQQPPLLWDEYFVGDRVPVWASNNLRERIPDADHPSIYQRVMGITISLDPEETVTELRVMSEPAPIIV